MGRILAIETATRVCSVALSNDGSILAESSLNIPQVHVERLVICIEEMLDNLHLSYRDIDAVAVSNGPGSFTGLRIGLSVGKGIAFAQDRKLIAVPTLDAIARGVLGFSDGHTIVPLLHARAAEFYYAFFKPSGSSLQRLGEYKVAESEEIAEECDGDVVFVGEGVGAFSASEAARKKFGPESMKITQASATEVAILAEEKLKTGEFSNLRSLAPLYIKDFVAIKGNPLNKLYRQTSGSRLESGLEEA